MQLLEAILLGVTQGLTEFLPVSSSGHLFLVRRLFGIGDIGGTTFDAFLHLGTLMAVFVYYWNVWVGIFRGLVRNDEEGADKRQLAAKLALATVPAAIVGFVVGGHFDEWFRSSVMVAFGLVVTGLVLLVEPVYAKALAGKRAGFADAFFIGLVQVLALVPGVSRSGVTIAAGRIRGLSRKQAVAFSFLISAPIIAGAGLASFQALLVTRAVEIDIMFVGFLVSFVSGWAAISWFMKVVEKISLVPFAIYLFLMAGILLYLG